MYFININIYASPSVRACARGVYFKILHLLSGDTHKVHNLISIIFRFCLLFTQAKQIKKEAKKHTHITKQRLVKATKHSKKCNFLKFNFSPYNFFAHDKNIFHFNKIKIMHPLGLNNRIYRK